MCQQYLMSPQNSWWWLSKNMLCQQKFDESAKWANLTKIRRVSKKTWWVRNMSGDDSTKRVLKSVLSVQFTCKSHSIHSCMHPWNSTIIVIRKINSYAMAKWNALHSSCVLVSCWVCGVGSGSTVLRCWWLGWRKNAESYAADFVFCSVISSIPCVYSRFPFQTFTMTLQRCLMTLVQLLHGELTLRCGVLCRGFSPFQLCENSFAVNGDSLQSFHKRTDCRRRAIIFLRLSVSRCIASKVVFISCTSDDVIVNDDTDDDTSIRYTLNRSAVFLSHTLIQHQPCVDFDWRLVYVARQRCALRPLYLHHRFNTILIFWAVVERVIAVKWSGIMNGKWFLVHCLLQILVTFNVC